MKKVIIAFPPINSDKGFPTYAQNRQFQYFKDPTFIYPIIPATFATMCLVKNCHIMWLDAVAESLNDVEFAQIILQTQPDFIVFEISTPLSKRYYEIINGLKDNIPEMKIIACGEHITACLDEAKEKCKADYFLTGGKWYYEAIKIVSGEDWPKDQILPHINRDHTRWWLYAYKNGNFKYIPATYIMAAQDCWHRPGCSFCSWANYHPEYYARPVDDVLQEVEELIEFGFKEIFDDSGTFPIGDWLDEFCNKFIERGYDQYISMGCNMRFGSLKPDQFKLLSKAGFRMILWGLESVHQKTLDKIGKGYSVDSIKHDLILAKAAGLQSHLTCMFGFPWEEYADAKKTYDMIRWLLINDWAFSAQATICIPYPGTRLFEECKKQNLLLTEDWQDYDMTKPVMKIPYSAKELFALQKGIYNTAFHPRFIFNKLKQVRGIEDLRYYMRIGHKIYDRFGNFSSVQKLTMEF